MGGHKLDHQDAKKRREQKEEFQRQVGLVVFSVARGVQPRPR